MGPFDFASVTLTDVIIAAVALFALILAMIAVVSSSGLRGKFKKWKGIHATADLEGVYRRTLDRVQELEGEIDGLRAELAVAKETLTQKVGTVQLMRYNAFAETGSDLSFSMALLDDQHNGVVLSSIYGRDESRTYAKPVVNGQSKYTLTEEEMQVIRAAGGIAVDKHRVHA